MSDNYRKTRVWICAVKTCSEVYMRSRFDSVLLDCPRCGTEDSLFPAFDGSWPNGITTESFSVQLDIIDEAL